MGSTKKYHAEDTLAKEKAAQAAAEKEANAAAAERGNADAQGGSDMFQGGALAKKKSKKGGSTLAGEGRATFNETTSTLGG
jgi:membrane protein involved in colicin uptake